LGPDFSFEDKIGGIVCGVDEVGRGPLAGPVVAAAVVLPRPLPDFLRRHLDDSKKLSARRRAELSAAILDCGQIGTGRAEVAEIDAINILQASLLAMRRAVEQIKADHALVDGNRAPMLGCGLSLIVKGDTLSLSIAAASIIAKVSRDREMAELAGLHPGYGWERNAGYGTAEHLAALARLGATPEHRRSFAPVRAAHETHELRAAHETHELRAAHETHELRAAHETHELRAALQSR
jgi:ribonuclease HII